MKRPAVFFDRDNTLIANDGYLGDPAGVVLIDGAADAITALREHGFAIVTVSNQSGVARGMFPEEAVYACNARLDELLADQNPKATIDRHEFCPYHPEAPVERYRQDSELRKPRPGMILQAAQRLDLDLSRSWLVGDAPRDIEAGRTAGCRTILFSAPMLKPSAAAEEKGNADPDFVVATLEEAAKIIIRESRVDANDASAESPTVSASKESSQDAVVASGRKLTFAERVRSGTFQPTRPAGETSTTTAERPRKPLPAATELSPAEKPVERPPERPAPAPAISDKKVELAPVAAPAPKPTEPVSQSEDLSPLLEQILGELRLLRTHAPPADFAVTKMLAGIVQILVLAVMFLGYMHRDVSADFQSLMLLALTLQAMTIALLIMSRQT